ncbi:TRADD-N-associated membrane domain-containing protein [Streptomyces cellulosae]
MTTEPDPTTAEQDSTSERRHARFTGGKRPIMMLSSVTLGASGFTLLQEATMLALCFAGLSAILWAWVATSLQLSADDAAARRVQEAEARLEAGLAQPGDDDDEARHRLRLSELWGVTHARLDRYHGIALKQARASFRNAQAAMILGFGMLVGFTVLGLRANSTAGSIVAGTLGVASAGLAGYVSRTFVRSQEAAATHLRSYFDQPLEFSRYLAAERLLNDSDLTRRERAAVVAALVEAMVARPGGPADPGAAGAAMLAAPAAPAGEGQAAAQQPGADQAAADGQAADAGTGQQDPDGQPAAPPSIPDQAQASIP